MDESRHSKDAKIVNLPRLIGGLPWQMVVFGIGFSGYAAFILHNYYLLPTCVVLLLFLSGAGRRDPLFLRVYLKHRVQASRYSPAPVSGVQMRNKRPIGYGRYDPN